MALALQDTLSNLFAGFQVIVSKQIRPGDYVQVSTGEEGYVTDIAWRYTTLRALPNNRIILPNSKLASAIVTNFYFPEKEMAVFRRVPPGFICEFSTLGGNRKSILGRPQSWPCTVHFVVSSGIEGGSSPLLPSACFCHGYSTRV